jgi:hypothetical protein
MREAGNAVATGGDPSSWFTVSRAFRIIGSTIHDYGMTL